MARPSRRRYRGHGAPGRSAAARRSGLARPWCASPAGRYRRHRPRAASPAPARRRSGHIARRRSRAGRSPLRALASSGPDPTPERQVMRGLEAQPQNALRTPALARRSATPRLIDDLDRATSRHREDLSEAGGRERCRIRCAPSAAMSTSRCPAPRPGRSPACALPPRTLYDVAGQRTGGGNPDWLSSHAPAAATAPAILSLVAAGATLVGKTVTDELAYSIAGRNFHYGTPTNVAA